MLGEHRYEHLLDDISKTARDGWLAHTRKQLVRLISEIPVSELTSDGKIDYEIFRDDLERTIWLTENTKPF